MKFHKYSMKFHKYSMKFHKYSMKFHEDLPYIQNLWFSIEIHHPEAAWRCLAQDRASCGAAPENSGCAILFEREENRVIYVMLTEWWFYGDFMVNLEFSWELIVTWWDFNGIWWWFMTTAGMRWDFMGFYGSKLGTPRIGWLILKIDLS